MFISLPRKGAFRLFFRDSDPIAPSTLHGSGSYSPFHFTWIRIRKVLAAANTKANIDIYFLMQQLLGCLLCAFLTSKNHIFFHTQVSFT